VNATQIAEQKATAATAPPETALQAVGGDKSTPRAWNPL
jgi:hypothetical protein